MESGIRAFARLGYAACTATIAAEAGISQPYLFRLFPTKERLFLACVDDVTGRARAALADAADPGGPPSACLRRMRAAYIEAVGPDGHLLCAQIVLGGDDGIRGAARARLRALLADAVRISGASDDALVRACADLVAPSLADLLAS